MEHVVIIGNGISGVTCARNLRKQSDCNITIISGENPYFFSRTALMYVYMGHMTFEQTQPYEDWFWEKNNIDLVFDFVEYVDTKKTELQLKSGTTIAYDKLVIATGSKPNKFNWKGVDLEGVQGLYSKQDLEQMEVNTKNCKHAVIVGGGLIGVEMAEMLLSRNISVTFLVRDKWFWGSVLPEEEGQLISNHIKHDHHVDLRLSTNLKEIVGENGKVTGVVIEETGETIVCDFVGLTVGVSPNIDFLKTSDIELEKGVLVDHTFKTNIDNVFAIGDCAQFKMPPKGRRPIEQVWYTGRMHGETLANTLAGNLTSYQPGHWFNSAKFFDIEYQTYGNVYPHLEAGQTSFYWENDKRNVGVKLVFESETLTLIGVNVFGLRLRHELLDKWLTQQKTVEHVLEHFEDANFDPELYKSYSKVLIEQFNQEFKTNLSVKKKSWKRILKTINNS